MKTIIRHLLAALTLSLLLIGTVAPAYAVDNPQSGSVGLEGTISAPPPTRAPTITTPGNGATFGAIPVTVNGLCSDTLLVKLFSNNVFVGSVVCKGNSYSLQIDLFSGRNDLVARQYDALDQSSPDSNVVTVTFNDAQVSQFGTRVTLTSPYARRGANPGEQLDWPIIISGGKGPYALSVDWGDGKGADLKSLAFSGTTTMSHVYANAGVYSIIVKATDGNGTTAYLQLVGVANGAVQSGTTGGGKSSNSATVILKIWWWPMLILLPLIFAAFWLGRRHELYALRQQIEKNAIEVE